MSKRERDPFGRDRDREDFALPIRPGVPPLGVGPPSGPHPGSMSQQQQQPLQPVAPGVAPPGVRMPPGPPPGGPPGIPPQTRPLLPKPLGVVSAKPQLNKVKFYIKILFQYELKGAVKSI